MTYPLALIFLSATTRTIAASLIVLFLTVSNVYAFEFSFGKKFLDYGNGAINLDNVTHMTPSITYRITLASDNPKNYLKQYLSNARKSSLEETSSWFSPDVYVAEHYYYYEIESVISFDLFALTVLEKVRFLKLPSNRDELNNVLEEKGDSFDRFLEALEKHLIEEEILEPALDVGHKLTSFRDSESAQQKYVHLMEDIPSLDEESASKVKMGLQQTANLYRQVVN